MKTIVRSSLILSIGLMIGLGLAIGQNVLADKETRATTLPIEELRTFTEVFARIKNDYVEKVDDRELLENAIRGMLSGLDPHSAYLNADQFKELQVGTSGEFGGLGIEVTMENGFVKVVAPIDDTPAFRAGIKAGDLIIRLNDSPVKGMTLSEAVKIMRGKPKTSIELTILRNGQQKPFKVTIVRDIIKVKSVKKRKLDPGFGYVRITTFQSKTGSYLLEAIEQLKQENGGELQGLVLDLRNNPGGVLNAAVEVSDAFLENGLVVYTEGRIKDSRMRFQATPGDVLNGAPLVVLVNGGSASASEIVSGALQDHKRGVIVGEKTFGKGSVQTILPMSNNNGIKLTTARYYTPSGRSIQAEGITPDIPLDPLKVEAVEKSGIERIKEADLSRHLSNGNGETKDAHKDGEDGDHGLDLARKDYPLYQALNLLKGMALQYRRDTGM